MKDQWNQRNDAGYENTQFLNIKYNECNDIIDFYIKDHTIG